MAHIIYIPAAQYHADPADTPSLSASVAHTLCTSSPWHAWTNHPRLNPDFRPDADPKYDVGTVCHAILLEGRDVVHVVDAADWRTNAAKEEREAARAAGKVPLLVGQYGEVEAMVDAARSQLCAFDPEPFTGGKPEQTVVWDEDGVACRALIDWLTDDRAYLFDLKTTSRSANPDAFSRNLYANGNDIQAWWYIRAVEAATGITPTYRWVVLENYPPYALSVIEPGADVLTIGMKKALFARNLWRRCLEADSWPGYPAEVVRAELPAWEEQSWLAKEIREEMAA